MTQFTLTLIGFLATTTLFMRPATANAQAGDKAPPWKAYLAPDDFQEVTKRSLDRIRVLARDPRAMGSLRAEAVLLAGYTMSVTDAATFAGFRQKALKVAQLAGDPKADENARKAARELLTLKLNVKQVGPPIEWTAAIGDVADLMSPLAAKAKRGDGIATELQYLAKLKTENGIESLLSSLAAKKLTATNAKKMSRELELVGYRVATVAALTRRRGPHKHKEDAPIWDQQSVHMRDASVELAHAAEKKDPATILTASQRLVAACKACHTAFK
jgi:hypothetical protein